jgi:hypothetical protein
LIDRIRLASQLPSSVLPVDRVTFCGQAVAVVVADEPALAEDLADQVKAMSVAHGMAQPLSAGLWPQLMAA